MIKNPIAYWEEEKKSKSYEYAYILKEATRTTRQTKNGMNDTVFSLLLTKLNDKLNLMKIHFFFF